MPLTLVQVPGALLLDRRLTSSAKAVWMADRWLNAPGATGTASLITHSGLSRETVCHALGQLAAAGWYPAAAGGAVLRPPFASGMAVLPGALITDTGASANARVLYGCLQLTTGYRGHSGAFTYAGLAALAGASVNTVKSGIKELGQKGWLCLKQEHRGAPVQFSLQSPGRAEAP